MLIFSLNVSIVDFEAFINGVNFKSIKFTDSEIIVVF